LAPAAAIAAICLALAACGGGDDGNAFTESVCPPTAPPTYDSFGRTFMEAYCTACHDEAKTGVMRQSAPPTIDFDTLANLRMWTSQIDKQAAIGPASANRRMPPVGQPQPSDDERRQLGAFIACEVAN